MAVVSPDPQVHRPTVDVGAVRRLTFELLKALGQDVNRPGLEGTPDRVARFWKEFIEYDAGNFDLTFEHMATDQMVIVKGIGTVSLCEHHMLPFSMQVAVGYIATEKVIGLSKIARIVHRVAHALQIQERICHEIADHIEQVAGTKDVAVYAEGEHSCMSMRGIRTPATMSTSVMRGKFFDLTDTRQEFLSIATR